MKVVVVSARGLRLSLLGPYGNLWVDTPALGDLAARGVVFDGHFANRADAAGARQAWRNGRLHLPVPGETTSLPGPDLIAALREKEVATWLILDASRGGPGFEVEAEFAEGWDAVEQVAAEGEGTPLRRSLAAAGRALQRLAGREHWLLWLDLATPLPPWEVPEEFLEPYFAEEEQEEEEEEEEEEDQEEDEEEDEEPLTPLREVEAGPIDPDDDHHFLSLQSSAAAAVSYLDAGVGQVLELLKELPGGEEVVVAFTADCGLPLGEHGVVGLVRPEPHEEVIHVPLMLLLPAQAPRRVDALTQAADLAPTLAALFDVALEGAQGQSLLPLARGEVENLRDYVCAGSQTGGAIGWCLRTREWSFLLPVVPEGGPGRLYVKPDDRWEVNDVVQHHLDLSEGLERTLRGYVTASCQPGPLTPPPLPQEESATDAHG
jgi:arylsulfatase A-like enzyme